MENSPKRTRRSRNKLGRGLSALVDTPKPTGVVQPQNPIEVVAPEEIRGADDRRDFVIEIRLADIYPNKSQPRLRFDQEALESLAESIRGSGLMQPIVVRARAAGGFEIIAGERRWRACGIAGLETVPAVVREVDDRQSAQWAMIENIQREDLNPIEKARGYERLSREFELTQQQIATRMGISRAGVANSIRLLDLDEQIQGMLIEGRLGSGHAKALLQCADQIRRQELASRAIEEGWSVRVLEREAGKKPVQGNDSGTIKEDSNQQRVGMVLADLGQQLGEYLGTRVVLKADKTGAKGSVQIEFYDLDHFDGLMSKIGFTPSET